MIYSQKEITDEKGTENVDADLLSRVTTDLTSESHQSIITFLTNPYFLVVQCLGLLII